MSDDIPQSIDIEAVADGLRVVRVAVPEDGFAFPTIPPVQSWSAVDALARFVTAVEDVRDAMVRESEGLANQVTIIALNAEAADQAALDQMNAPPSGTTTVPMTTSTVQETVPPLSEQEPTGGSDEAPSNHDAPPTASPPLPDQDD